MRWTPPAANVAPTLERMATAHTTRLRGWRLHAARTAWVFVVAWILANFALSLPGQLHTFQHPSATSTELAPDAVIALRHAGITLHTYAWIAVGFGSLVMLAATTLALVLFWRRSDDWMALLVSLLFPAYCLLSLGPSESFHAAPSGPPLAIGNTILLPTIAFAVIYAVFMLFPSGRFVPSWSWALLVACVAWFAAHTAMPALTILFLGYPLFLGAAIACQIHRYRSASTPMDRQQTRWAVFGLVTALLVNQAFWQTINFAPVGKTIFPPFAYLVLYGSVLLIPITFFIAIQRYRLYEIDALINRALVYAMLTAILVGVYAATVLGAQTITRQVSGQTGQQPVVIVATTLLIAALFAPLRRRIQSGIDRAFYRGKYDAGRTLRAFGATVRMETDLKELSDHVVAVVQQTIRPAHVSLWLHTPIRLSAEPSEGRSRRLGDESVPRP